MSGKTSLLKRYGDRLAEKEKGWVCHYCHETIIKTGDSSNPNQATVDHLLPQSRGGKTELSNLVLACRPCNSSKHNKTIEEWREREAQKPLPYLYLFPDGELVFMRNGLPIASTEARRLLEQLSEFYEDTMRGDL